jgi:DHA3 family macrolide efflux protein-like MFS transporter
MRSFSILWFGELVSMLGSRTSGFALSVWMYQVKHDVTSMALVVLMASLPGSLMGPLLGPIVDKLDRRQLLLWGNAARAAWVGIMVVATFASRLSTPLIYACQFGIAIFAVLSLLTMSTVTPQLVTSKELIRANGMLQTSEAIGEIAAPLIAGVLLTWSSLAVILSLDFVSFFAAIAAILVIDVPKHSSGVDRHASMWSLGNLCLGWRYLAEHRSLGGLLLFITVINFLLSMAVLLFRPLVLSVASPATLGIVLSFGASGMLIGALTMTVWMKERPNAKSMLCAASVCGVSLGLAGVSASIGWLIATAFVCFLCAPMIGASNQAIWQAAVPSEIQGRVFGIGTMLNGIVIPLSQVLSGPLADRWFEPALRRNGTLAPTIGVLIGVGPGRGIGFMLILIGLAWSTVVIITLSSRGVRGLDGREISIRPGSSITEASTY